MNSTFPNAPHSGTQCGGGGTSVDEIWGWYQSRGAEPTLRAAGGRAAGAVGGVPPGPPLPVPPLLTPETSGGMAPQSTSGLPAVSELRASVFHPASRSQVPFQRLPLPPSASGS